jgi:hypothetical protein
MEPYITPKDKAADMVIRLCDSEKSMTYSEVIKTAIEMADNTIKIYQNISGEGPEKEVIYWNEVKKEIQLIQ